MKKIFLILLITLLGGCASTPELSPMQKRQITTKTLNSDYDTTFRAIMTVLQDHSYIIKTADKDSGLITAKADKETSGGSRLAQSLLLGYVANKGSEIELSATISPLNKNNTDVRINILEVKYGHTSRWGGSEKTDVSQIYDPEVYRVLFADISREIERLRAINNL